MRSKAGVRPWCLGRRNTQRHWRPFGRKEIRDESSIAASFIFATAEGTFSPIQALGTGGLT
jgi:hypothetical protein